jgi:hypothetical protein
MKKRSPRGVSLRDKTVFCTVPVLVHDGVQCPRFAAFQNRDRADGQRVRGHQHADHDARGHGGDASAGARRALREVHAQRGRPATGRGDERRLALQPGERHDCPQARHHGNPQVGMLKGLYS